MRKTPRQQRSSFTVDVIVEAATRLLGKEGRSLTTNRIAALAGTSIGSVYQYFGSKQAIFNEIALRHLTDAERELSDVLERNPPGTRPWREVLDEVIAVSVAANRTHGSAHGLLRHLVDSAPLITRYERFLAGMAERFAEYLVVDGWRPDDAAAAGVLTIATIDAQVHLLVRSDLDNSAITAQVTAFVVGALTSLAPRTSFDTDH